MMHRSASDRSSGTIGQHWLARSSAARPIASGPPVCTESCRPAGPRPATCSRPGGTLPFAVSSQISFSSPLIGTSRAKVVSSRSSDVRSNSAASSSESVVFPARVGGPFELGSGSGCSRCLE